MILKDFDLDPLHFEDLYMILEGCSSLLYQGHSREARDMDLLLRTRVMTIGEGLSSTNGKVKSLGL